MYCHVIAQIAVVRPFCFQMWLTWSETTWTLFLQWRWTWTSPSAKTHSEFALASTIGWCTAAICIWRSGLYTELWAEVGNAFSRTQRWVPCWRNQISTAQHIQRFALRRYFALQCRWQWKLTLSVRTTATRRSVALPWIRMSQQVLSIWREKCSMFL